MQNIEVFKRKMLTAGLAMAGVLMCSSSVWAEPVEYNAQKNMEKGAYADVNTCLNIRQGAGMEFSVLAQLPKNGYCEVIRDEGDWCYIISQDIEGYVFEDYLAAGLTKEEYLERTGLEQAVYAYPIGQKSAVQVSAISSGRRQEIVNYALQFVGNPYVWGGTSLTEGADCSGFVQSIYRDFGISLPRVACDQANAGTKISAKEAQPGDLIFYADNGYIYHVVMYIGNNQVVHASSASTGIKISKVHWEKAVSGVKLL